MKGGLLGFTRREVLVFTFLFISSIILMVYCSIKLVHKYYKHSSENYTEIKNYSNDIWELQEITLFAVNTQRSSLNAIIYSGDSSEMKNVTSSLSKNRDSLVSRLQLIEKANRIEKSLLKSINITCKEYLEANRIFLKIAVNPAKKEEAAAFNINTMRPALRRFNDITRQTNKFITQQIHNTAQNKLLFFSQFEFWLLAILLLPYLYFFFRFLQVIARMIFWDAF